MMAATADSIYAQLRARIESGDVPRDGPAKRTPADFAPFVGRIGEEVAKQFEVGLIPPDGGLGEVDTERVNAK